MPDDVFYYISRITPLINVDLLIKAENGRTLLAWRDDVYAGSGWHLPGGIVRFKETLETRLAKVAESEIGAALQFDPAPIAVHQMIHTARDIRGHFISFLYNCSLSGSFVPENKGLGPRDRGYLKWHKMCPANLLPVHEIYREYINSPVGRKNDAMASATVYI